MSNLAQTISESWRTLNKMGSTEVCKKRAEEAHTRAEQSVYPSEQEAWLRVASEWTKLAQTCDHPINGVMGALKRIYRVDHRNSRNCAYQPWQWVGLITGATLTGGTSRWL